MNDSCHSVSPLLPYLVVGSLDGNERFLALRHIHACASCRRELAFLTKVATEAANAWSPPINRNVLDRTLLRLHQHLDQDAAESGKTTMSVESQNPILGYILENNVSPLSVVGGAVQVVKDAVRNYCTATMVASFEEVWVLGRNWLSWFQIGT